MSFFADVNIFARPPFKIRRSHLNQWFSTTGPRTGAGPHQLSCRSAKYITILYLNCKMQDVEGLSID